MKLTYGIIGVGGIGGYFGGKLAKNGENVHFLFHSDYQYVKEHGLRVDSIDGDFILPQVNAYSKADDMPVCDVVLVGMKTMNNHLLKKILPPIVNENSLVILVQNGLGVEADLAKDFPDLQIAGGLAFICTSKVGSGHIVHQDIGTLNIGAYSCKNQVLIDTIVSDFIQSGVKAFSVNLESARWKKLIWNIPYNGLSVVLNAQTDEMTTFPATRNLISQMMKEVIEASRAIGVQDSISDDAVDQMLKMTESMKPYAPSMKLDYDNHRPLEIEYIYSRPIAEARKAGYEMTSVAVLEKQLKFLDSKNR